MTPSQDSTRNCDARAPFNPVPGSAAPFSDRQRVSLSRWDKCSPKWDRMGDCIVINQQQGPDHCESGWMVTVMAKDGTTRKLDSHWMEALNDQNRNRAEEQKLTLSHTEAAHNLKPKYENPK